ncbi:hypothetical protein [Heyndrickxia oleronia]|uniref:hypothetical protein n=1 Tax=Heyndrickxia oleronia TaxID=38875 RepID=UPI001B1F4C56|nr:hypothetical protein [Heyndrickxia oleronia]GIN38058.1 hypothetical protein J19TS1_10070 [Heyndrickxia oleronia]
MARQKPTEALLWSIAFPGFGQIINGKYVKGLVFLILEVLINVKAHFNAIIVLSFHGEIEKSIALTNYDWLMFYPCLYFFSMWDAFKDAGGGKNSYTSIIFVFTAYTVTVGTIYSSTFTLFGQLFGPIWLPILSVIPGIAIGLAIKALLISFKNKVE